jgi:hypothetical protein
LKVTIYSQQQTNEVDIGNSLELCDSYVQVYDDIARFAMKLTRPCSFMLMFWIFKNLDQENRVRLNINDKKRFLSAIVEVGAKPITVRAVSYAMRELVSVGFMSMLNKGTYEVTVASVSKSGSKRRLERVKYKLYRLPESAENFNGLPIKKVKKGG